MNNHPFEPEDPTFDELVNSLPSLPMPDLTVDQAEIDALIANLTADDPTLPDPDATQPAFDPQEMQDWLNSLAQSTPDLDL